MELAKYGSYILYFGDHDPTATGCAHGVTTVTCANNDY